MESLIVFEAGVRSPEGKYSVFKTSPNRAEIEEYIRIIDHMVAEDFEILFSEKFYTLVTTTPTLIKRKKHADT